MDQQSLETQIGILGQKFQDLSDRVERGFREVRDNTVDKIRALEKDKADKDEVERVRKVLEDNHEVRIRHLEQIGAMAIGGLFILELVLKFIFK